MSRAAICGGARAGALLRAAMTATLVLVAATACTTPPRSESESKPVLPVLAAPAESPATRTPPLALIPVPTAGTVLIEPGPFTDRLQVTSLSLLTGDHPTVIASVSNTADVSELILLEVRADFYDVFGNYVGSGTASYADEEFTDNGATPRTHGAGEHSESFDITISSTKPVAGAVSAVLTIPQLVNE